MASLGIKQAKVSPHYLHSNSTSHTWPFSAFAELIDNAYDPDVSAKELWIDVKTIGNQECLTFLDNGNGMSPDKLHKMLSFGFSEKEALGKFKPIGRYGNGFKSGSMRLGVDALVITRCLQSTSIGFLSQTYLKETEAETVVVPIVTWQLNNKDRIKKNTKENIQSLKAILQHSLIKTEEELNAELDVLEPFKTGTKIIIYNLKRDSCGTLELDFKSNPTDIRYPETATLDASTTDRPVENPVPEYRRSLRKYCSILFLSPRLKIYIRGQKVKSELIDRSLLKTETDVYKPKESKRRTGIRIVFGFTTDNTPEAYGMMLFHNNRLIKAYEKVGCQNKVNREGIGVLGVAEVNDLHPTHNKQDFERSKEYISFMAAAASKLNDYYYEKTHTGEAATSDAEDGWRWANCDQCLAWRRLPKGYKDELPDKWFCYNNPDAMYNRCEIPEEPHMNGEEEITKPSYKKTYKQKQAKDKKQKKLEEEQKAKEHVQVKEEAGEQIEDTGTYFPDYSFDQQNAGNVEMPSTVVTDRTTESASLQVNETVEKYRVFLNKVLHSAALLSQETLISAQCHVQDLIDGKIEPEQFIEKFQMKKGNPNMTQFLKEGLPVMQQASLRNEVSIDGVRAPPLTLIQQQSVGGGSDFPEQASPHSLASNVHKQTLMLLGMQPDAIDADTSGNKSVGNTEQFIVKLPGFTMAQRRKNLDNSTISTPAKIQRNSCESATPASYLANRGSALKGNTPRCAAKGKAPLKFSLTSASNHVSGNAIENVVHNNHLNPDNSRTRYQYETSHHNLKATENSIRNIFQNQFNEMEFDVKPSKQDLDNIMNEMDEILKEPCISDEHQIEQKVFQEKSCQTDTELSINTEEDDANLHRLTPLEHHQAMKLKNYKESFEKIESELLKERTNHKETKHTIEILQREKLETKQQLDEREDRLTNCQTELKNLSEEYIKTKHSLEILTKARIMEQKQLDAAKEALENSKEKLNKQITEHKETQRSLDTLKKVSSIDKKQLEETKKELEKLKVEKSKETRELNNRIQLEKSDRSHDLERLHQMDLERLHQLEKELSEERNEHTETKQILERIYNDKVSLNQEFIKMKTELDKLNEEKAKQKQELLDTKSSVESMMKKQLWKEKQHLIDTSVIESLKAENRKLMEKLEETKKSVKDERVNGSQGSEETVDHLKSQFLQRGHELQEQKTALEEQKTATKRLKLNILTLMKLIVPEYEYGDPENIENVILEFIAANNEHSGSRDSHS